MLFTGMHSNYKLGAGHNTKICVSTLDTRTCFHTEPKAKSKQGMRGGDCENEEADLGGTLRTKRGVSPWQNVKPRQKFGIYMDTYKKYLKYV